MSPPAISQACPRSSAPSRPLPHRPVEPPDTRRSHSRRSGPLPRVAAWVAIGSGPPRPGGREAGVRSRVRDNPECGIPLGPETCPVPGIRYDRSEVQAAISASRPDPWTAVAILTHDIEQEHAALTATLATNAGYVGVLGSRRRAPERDRTPDGPSGVSSHDIQRMHAPIGLPIGGKSPWEIAISVIAEIVRDLDAMRLY